MSGESKADVKSSTVTYKIDMTYPLDTKPVPEVKREEPQFCGELEIVSDTCLDVKQFMERMTTIARLRWKDIPIKSGNAKAGKGSLCCSEFSRQLYIDHSIMDRAEVYIKQTEFARDFVRIAGNGPKSLVSTVYASSDTERVYEWVYLPKTS